MSWPGTDRQAEAALFEEAAEWFARMRGPDAEASRAGLDAWLARGEGQRSAYNRAAEVFAMGKLLGRDQGGERPGHDRPSRIRLPAMASLGFSAIATVAVLLISTSGLQGSRRMLDGARRGGEVALLSAPAGGERLVRLGDGSIVRLGGSTRLDVRFTGKMRSLALDRGSARFKVAHEGRPFVVLAGGGSVTAHGTIFDVALGADRRVSVGLVEGSVDVRLPSPGKDSVRRLRPGEKVSFEAAGPAGRSPSATENMQAQGAPAKGTAAEQAGDYDSVRLADLIAAANHKASPPIRLADTRTGERRVSGRFRISDTALLAERLALLFDLDVDRSDRAEIVLRSR